MALGGDQGGSIRLPVVLERLLRPQADLGPRAVHGHLPDRADDRPHRPDGAHGRRLRGDAGRDRGRGRARPAPERRVRAGLHGGARGRRRRPAGGRVERGLRDPGRLRARRRRRRARGRRHAGRGGRRGRGGLDPDAPRRAGDLERDRDRGRDRPDGPRRRLRHEPQGPLLDRPRRLLRPRAPRPRRRLLRHGQAHGADGRLPLRGLQPPLLRQGPEPRAAAEGRVRGGARALRRAACCPRRR